MMSEQKSDWGAVLGLKWVRLAIGIIPLCLTGIFLIFYLKPSLGLNISGLAVLTASVQAMAALSIVLLFMAVRQYLKFREDQKVIPRTVVPESVLLQEAFRIGRYPYVDTQPNPEHREEWAGNVRMAIGGRLMDLLDSHPVLPHELPLVLAKIEEGFRVLLKAHYIEEEGRLSTLSLDEIYALFPLIFEPLSRDPLVLKRLQSDSSAKGEAKSRR
ncbi:MAG: hypothetical protein M1297_08300 [Nitrospirae bacterium]|jgi:hypothetical protein|nr:hypothetical protein [Nitrospirota bacterium]